jgi:transcriptional regulator with XRE-family HTH domain
MTDPQNAWQDGVEELGRFIHAQRKLAKLSLRELAGLTDLSNAYLSQLERGLHEPSMRVINSIANALDLSAETILRQAGLFAPGSAGAPGTPAPAEATGPVAPTEESIQADPFLTESQKEALLAVYRGFAGRDARQGDDAPPP